MSDRDVVESTIQGSPDLVVSRAQQRIYRQEERRQRAALWAPVLSMDSFWRQGRTPMEQYLRSASGTIDETTFDLLFRLNGRTSLGTTYELRFDNRRDTSSAYTDFVPYSPIYRSELAVSVVQPLLRGASPQGNTSQIATAAKTAAAQEAETRRVAEQLVEEAVARYYAWAGALAQIGVRRTALKLAEDQRAATLLKIKGGALSPLEVAQADATLSARKAEIVDAERQSILAERDMLRVAYLHLRQGFNWSVTLVPATQLTEAADVPGSVEDGIQMALRERPEIRRQEDLVRAQEPQVQAFKWARLWRLDVRAQLGALGLAGEPNRAGPAPADSFPNPNPLDPRTLYPGQQPFAPNARLNGSFLNAIAHPFSMGTYYYMFGITLEIPLSNVQRNAEYEQADLELQKRRAELERVRVEIAVGVRSAVLQFRADREAVRLGKEAVRLAEVNLDAEQRKFRGGVSTTFDVLRVQAEVSMARLSLVKAIVQLNISGVELRRQLGTLLGDYGIKVSTR